MSADALRGSLLSAERLRQDAGELAEAEPATITAGGMVASYRAKVRPAVEVLERRGLLEWRQARAARRLYRSYSIGIVGAREKAKGCSAWTPAGYTDLQISAAGDFRAARVAVGGADWELCFAVCVLDVTVKLYVEERLRSTSGRLIGLTLNRLRGALTRLADHYDQCAKEDKLT